MTPTRHVSRCDPEKLACHHVASQITLVLLVIRSRITHITVQETLFPGGHRLSFGRVFHVGNGAFVSLVPQEGGQASKVVPEEKSQEMAWVGSASPLRLVTFVAPTIGTVPTF